MHHSLLVSSALAAVGLGRAVTALDAAGWRNQSIYQLLTDRFARSDGSAPLCDSGANLFCNGSWAGITHHLDYIQGLGATAVWISPVNQNVEGDFGLDGTAYHGYWTQNLYALNPHFGTADDLKALSDGLHKRGMYLMVDIVPNHSGPMHVAGDYSGFQPFNDSKYYHPKCRIRWGDIKSEQLCWLEHLPDLRTEDEAVRALYRGWIKELVQTYQIDGLRIDAALEIEPEFWTKGGFRDAAGVFLLAEVNRQKPVDLAPYQAYLDGLLDFGTSEVLFPAFQANARFGALAAVADEYAAMGSSIDMSVWGSFVEDADQPRFPSLTQDLALAKNVIAFAMLRDGIPVVYYGQEQHYAGGKRPLDREALWLGQGYNTGDSSPLYGWIRKLNAIRRAAAEADAAFLPTARTTALFYRDGGTAGPGAAGPGAAGVIAFRKGQMVTMFSNGGVNATNNVTYAVSRGLAGYNRSAEVVDVLHCERFDVAKSGFLHVQMPAGGLPRVFLPAEQAGGLCANTTGPVADAWPNLVYIRKKGD